MIIQRSAPIDMVVTQPLGSAIQVTGLVSAVREFGKIAFFVVKDAFSEIQVIAASNVHDGAKAMTPPCYATVAGVLRRRPPGDIRADAINGWLEINAEAVHIHTPALSANLLAHLAPLKALVAYLQSRGFTDLQALLATVVRTDTSGDDDEREQMRYLSYLIGPSRWYCIRGPSLHFGITPGSIVDLRKSFRDDVSGHEAAARDMKARAEWHEYYPDAPGEPAPVASGVLRMAAAGELVRDAAAAFPLSSILEELDDKLIFRATRRKAPDDVGTAVLRERLARGQALLEETLRQRCGSHYGVLAMDFPEFDLRQDDIQRITTAFPSLLDHLADCDIERQFEILWSLVGHDHVRSICGSETALELLSAGVLANLFTDYNVLRYLDVGALECIASLTHGYTQSEAMAVVKRLVNLFPSRLSSAVSLMATVDAAGLPWERCAPLAESGLFSQAGFMAVALGLASPEDVALWRSWMASRLESLFTNAPVDEVDCRSALEEAAARFPWIRPALLQSEPELSTFDIVHLVFDGGLLGYSEAASLFARSVDCSGHWAAACIEFGGGRWNADKQAFSLSGAAMYPSKNRAGVLAKSCSGICSARDIALFQRNDHFQFTLVPSTRLAAAGTVQLYTGRDVSGRDVWIVRGLNPSERFETSLSPVKFTLEVLDTISSLARINGADAVLLGDGRGLFNADSARLPIRTVMRRIAAGAVRVELERPLDLFEYHGRSIEIRHGSQIWP